MVCTRTAMAATAARNRALRGGSRNARPPTGTRSSKPEAAGDAAAGMQQQHQAGDVDGRLNDGLDVRARQALAHQNDAGESEAQIEERRRRRKAAAIRPAGRASPPRNKGRGAPAAPVRGTDSGSRGRAS